MVNPFDLRGPEFLVFYGCLGAAVTVLVILMRRAGERGDPPHPLSDYLEIAYLRGGAAEAIRVAILTLVNRGMLTLSGDDAVEAGRQDAAGRVTKSDERAILSRTAIATKAQDVIDDTTVTGTVTAECEPTLVRRGLLPSPDQRAVRTRLFLAAGGALAAVAAIKIVIAISRGRSNVGFLVCSASASCSRRSSATHPRRTPAGNALVGDLRTLFGGLKDRANSLRPAERRDRFGPAGRGVRRRAALPVYPEAKKLFPRSARSDGGGSSDSSVRQLVRQFVRRRRRRLRRLREQLIDGRRAARSVRPDLASAAGRRMLTHGHRLDIVEVIPEGRFLDSRRARRALRTLARRFRWPSTACRWAWRRPRAST